MNKEFIEIGQRVEKIRLSQPGKPNKKEFASLIKIPHQNLGLIERGEIGLSRENLISICKETGVSADYILFGKNVELIKEIQKNLSNYSEEQIEMAFQVMKSLLKVYKV